MELILFSLLVAATAAGLRPVQERLMAGVKEARDVLIADFEANTGLKVVYGSMGPSVFRAVDLRDLRVSDPDGHRLLAISRFRFTYSIVDILAGRYLQSLRSVQLYDPELTLDLQRDVPRLDSVAALFSGKDPSRDPQGEGAGAVSALRELFSSSSMYATVRNASISLRDGDAFYSANGLSLRVDSEAGRYALRSSAALSAVAGILPSSLGEVRTEVELDGTVAPDFSQASGKLSLRAFDSSLLAFEKETVLFRYGDGKVSLERMADRLPLDASLSWSSGTGAFGFALSAEGLVLGKAAVVKGLPKEASRILDGARVSGRLGGTYTEASGVHGDTDLDIFVPRGPLPSPSRIGLKGTLVGDEVSVERLSFAGAGADISFSGRLALTRLRPEGTVTVRSLRLPDGTAATGTFAVAEKGAAISIATDVFDFGPLRLNGVDIEIVPDPRSPSLTASAFRYGGTNADGSPMIGQLAVDASLSVRPSPFLQLSVSLDDIAGSDLLTLASPFMERPPALSRALSILQDVDVSAECFVNTDFSNTSFSVPRVVAAWHGDRDLVVVASVDGNGGRVSVRDLSVAWTGGKVTGNFEADLADLSDVLFSARATYAGTTYGVEGTVLDGRSLSFRGDYGLEGWFQFGSGGEVSATASAASIPVPLGSMSLNVAFSSDFRWMSATDWSLRLTRLLLTEPGGSLPTRPRLTIGAVAGPSGAVVNQVRLEDSVGTLEGRGRLDWGMSDGTLRLDLALGEGGDGESYDATATLSGDRRLAVDLSVGRARLAHFLADHHNAVLTGSLRGDFSEATSPTFELTVDSGSADWQGSPLTASFSASMDADQVAVKSLNLDYQSYAFRNVDISASKSSGKASMNFTIRGSAGGLPFAVAGLGSLAFTPFGAWTEIGKASENFSGNVSISSFNYETLTIAPFSLDFSKDAALFSASGGPSDSMRALFDLGSQSFSISLGAPLPIRGSVVGSARGGDLDARASGLYLDFPALWRVLSIKDVDFTGGIMTGQLDISGPVGDPEFYGTVQAMGVRCAVPSWLEGEASAADTTVTFDGNEFVIPVTPVNAGKGGGQLWGRFVFDRWIPSIFDLSIRIPQGRDVKVKSTVAGIIASGAAAGDLRIQNLDGPLTVEGDLALQNTVIALDTKALMQAQNAAYAPDERRVSIKLTTGKKVEFDWPSDNFPILRGYADAGDSVNIAWDGASGRYSIVGEVSLRGGDVFYVQRSFYIRDGSIKFNENELRFDPLLSVTAEIREYNDEGPVTVSLVAENERLSLFTPRLVSDPPLSQIDIISLLGGNLLGIDESTGVTSLSDSVIGVGTDILSQFNIVRSFESKVRDVLNLDMFSIRTRLVQNAVLKAVGIQLEPVDTNAGLGNYFDNTTVYMGKSLGPDLFLQATLRAVIDEEKKSDPFGGLTLEPDIGLEWKTPLFNLRWDFEPSNPENLFVSDNSFTFSWRYSF